MTYPQISKDSNYDYDFLTKKESVLEAHRYTSPSNSSLYRLTIYLPITENQVLYVIITGFGDLTREKVPKRLIN